MNNIGTVVVSLITLVIFKFGIGYVWAEYEVSQSITQAWPEVFKKEYITSCADQSNEAFLPIYKKQINNEELAVNFTRLMANNYCSCMQNVIEIKKIIPTKYNSYKKSMSDYSNEVYVIAKTYYETEEGDIKVTKCVEEAQLAAMDIIRRDTASSNQ